MAQVVGRSIRWCVRFGFVGALLLAGSAACGSDAHEGAASSDARSLTSVPERVLDADEPFVDSFEELVAMSDLVAVVNVTEARAADQAIDGTIGRLVQVEVVDVLTSRLRPPPKELTITTTGWDEASGDGLEVNGTPWLFKGDRAIVFLDAVESEFVLTVSGGQLVEQNGAVVPPNRPDDPFFAGLEGVKVGEVTRRIERAAASVADGSFDLDAYRAQREQLTVAQAFTGPVREVASGTKPESWTLQAAPTEHGFCWAAGAGTPSPTACVDLSSVEATLQRSKARLVVLQDRSLGIVYGLASGATESVTVKTGDGEDHVVAVSPVPFGNGEVGYFVYESGSARAVAGGATACSASGCEPALTI